MRGGPRRRPAADRRSLCRAVSRLSLLAAALGEAVAEIDVNPLIVSSQGCLAVDAVVKGRASAAAAGDIPPDPP